MSSKKSSDMSTKKSSDKQKDAADVGELLSKLSMEDQVHDVTLKGSDGVEVTAVRSILAAKCPFFKAMLYGGFLESSKDTIEINEYTGSVLEAVVEYTHKGEAQILSLAEWTSQDCQVLVSLAAAAQYYCLPGLLEKAKKILSMVHNKKKISTEYSLAVLDACVLLGSLAVPKEILALAWDWVRSNPPWLLDTKVCNRLSQVTMEAILKDQGTPWNEYQLFTLLETWAKNGPTNADRMEAGKQMLVDFIQLEKIAHIYLSSSVKSSGLASKGKLFVANFVQGWADRESRPIFCHQGRVPDFGPFNWSTNSACFKLLKCQPLRSGKYQWTLKRNRSYKDCKVEPFYGVTSTVNLDPNVSLCGQKGVWGFQGAVVARDGEVTFCMDGTGIGGFRVEQGEHMTVTLDLRKGNGILSAHIQKEDGSRVLFGRTKNLLGHLRDSQAAGFIPAIGGGRYDFDPVGFKKL